MNNSVKLSLVHLYTLCTVSSSSLAFNGIPISKTMGKAVSVNHENKFNDKTCSNQLLFRKTLGIWRNGPGARGGGERLRRPREFWRENGIIKVRYIGTSVSDTGKEFTTWPIRLYMESFENSASPGEQSARDVGGVMRDSGCGSRLNISCQLIYYL